jgi:hypothetical protein
MDELRWCLAFWATLALRWGHSSGIHEPFSRKADRAGERQEFRELKLRQAMLFAKFATCNCSDGLCADDNAGNVSRRDQHMDRLGFFDPGMNDMNDPNTWYEYIVLYYFQHE